jgi:hypothetical protein
MTIFLRRSGVCCLLASALASPCAVASPIQPGTVFGRVIFDPNQNALVLPYLGPAPHARRRTLNSTHIDYEFPAARFLSPSSEYQTLKGPLTGFSVVNTPAGGIKVSLAASRALAPRVEVDPDAQRVLLFPFGMAVAKGAHVPLLLVSEVASDTTVVGSAVYVSKDNTLVVNFTGPPPRFTRKSLGATHFYYDLSAARLRGRHAQKQAFNGPMTRVEVANRKDGAVRVAFESLDPMAPKARMEPGRFVIALGLSQPQHKVSAPASGSIKTQVQGAFFDTGRQALVIRYTGAMPSYSLNRVAATAFGVDFARTALLPSSSNNAGGTNPSARWWLTSAPQDQAVHVNLTMPVPGDLLVAADALHGQLLLIPQPAGNVSLPLPPQHGVQTVFGRAHFDWYVGGVALSYTGLTPPYVVEAIDAQTSYVNFANAALKPDGVQLERITHFNHLSSWLLAQRPAHDLVRLALYGLAGAHVKIQDDRAHHRLLISPVAALGKAVIPAPSATNAQEATGALRPASPGMR